MYAKLKWLDHVVDKDGNVLREGTLKSAENFNHMEEGIEDSSLALALLATQVAEFKRNHAAEEHDVTLKNSDVFPFNNSATTVALDHIRASKDYDVKAEATGNNVGDVIVYDKLLNGFKVRYTGSAKSADIKLYVKGGE